MIHMPLSLTLGVPITHCAACRSMGGCETWHWGCCRPTLIAASCWRLPTWTPTYKSASTRSALLPVPWCRLMPPLRSCLVLSRQPASRCTPLAHHLPTHRPLVSTVGRSCTLRSARSTLLCCMPPPCPHCPVLRRALHLQRRCPPRCCQGQQV